MTLFCCSVVLFLFMSGRIESNRINSVKSEEDNDAVSCINRAGESDVVLLKYRPIANINIVVSYIAAMNLL